MCISFFLFFPTLFECFDGSGIQAAYHRLTGPAFDTFTGSEGGCTTLSGDFAKLMDLTCSYLIRLNSGQNNYSDGSIF